MDCNKIASQPVSVSDVQTEPGIKHPVVYVCICLYRVRARCSPTYVCMQHAVGVYLVYSNYPKWCTSGASGNNEIGKLKF